MKASSLQHTTSALRALAHPKRLRACALLLVQPLRVCQLGAALMLSYSTISTHLSILRDARLVEEQRRGRGVMYRITRDAETRRILQSLVRTLATDPVAASDRVRLERALAVVPEELCAVSLNLTKLPRRRSCAQ